MIGQSFNGESRMQVTLGWRSLSGLTVLAGLLVVIPLAGAARGETLLVSRASGGGAADGFSQFPSISADGRHVAFAADADNLSGEDDNEFSNVFLRDSQAGTTTLVSRATGAAGAGGDGGSYDTSISADGRYVAFHSGADNLSAEDTDAPDIFVRDIQAGTTTLVSRATGAAGAGADDQSLSPSISAAGRHVAFMSFADNLSAEDNNAHPGIFVRDLQVGTTTLVSRATGAAGAGADDYSFAPSTSAAGRYVAFASFADNLSAEDNNAHTNVFVRDIQAGTTTLVSRATGLAGAGADGLSQSPSISADGRYVAFESGADNLSAEDNNAFVNVFVRDIQAGTTTLVSRATGPAGAGADGLSRSMRSSSISADGRHVAFDSPADNLSTNDNNAYFNIFVRDIQAGTTTLVSRASGPGRVGGDGSSSEAALSAEGRHVAFGSDADNLSAEDDNTYRNIFRRDLLRGPPRCTSTAKAAKHNTPMSVALPCADEDGDAVTRTIVARPAHGTLGPINQATGTVSYTPVPGYSGPDTFSFRASDANGNSNVATARLTVSLLPGRCANRLVGTNAGERIQGTTAGDRIRGGGGADILNGLQGADCLEGGTGTDRLNGGAGNDSLAGGPGRNSYSGGPGGDTIAAANGTTERVDCGPGRDTVSADPSDQLRGCEVVSRVVRR